jgi:hypothetical protein
MSNKRFWLFEGSTVEALESDVSDAVFNNFNTAQATKVVSGHCGQFGEVWWFYPSAGSSENDSYVIWNYRKKLWYTGSLARTCWVDAGVWSNPYAVGADNYVYRHEDGWLDNGSTRVGSVYAETGVIDLGQGDDAMDVMGLIQDEDAEGSVRIRFKTRMTPGGAESSYGPFVVRSDGYTDARFSGRQLVMRVETAVDGQLRFGTVRLDVRKGSKR